MKVANVTTEDSGISTSPTRMATADSAITTAHYPRLPAKRSDIGIFHRVTNNAGAIADDLHIKLDGADAFLPADLFHIPILVFWMSLATENGNVRWATNIRQSARDVRWIVMTATRNENSNGRTPGIVRETIGGNTLPPCALFINHPPSTVRPSPAVHASHLNARDLHREAPFPADLNCL